jgi:hypothetical protein
MKRGGAKRVFRKEGGAFAPTSPSLEAPENKIGGKLKIKRRCIRNVKEKQRRFYLD